MDGPRGMSLQTLSCPSFAQRLSAAVLRRCRAPQEGEGQSFAEQLSISGGEGV